MPSHKQLANALRVLSMDAVQKAKSGHPGMPMGMADIAQVLWNDFLKHNPLDPQWLNRDRFILSNGHGSMLQYALLHLSGYDLTLEDLQQFRQLHSKTPGHPELGYTPGVETTTGPLGQGIANAVGMALAQKILAATFNREHFPIIDHYTYVFLGDGCLMEGISHEVCSFAGTQKLHKLIAFWDDNGISIDGKVEHWFSDSTPTRFKAYDWHVISDVDGHDPQALKAAIAEAQSQTERPTLICCKTIIGFGAPHLAGSEKAHGAPLGDAEILATREKLQWPYEPFVIPSDIYAAWDAKEKGAMLQQQWQTLFEQYTATYPELSAQLQRRLQGQLPTNWSQEISRWIDEQQAANATIATRQASQRCINKLVPLLPELLGGSADLTHSNLTMAESAKAISGDDASGNYIYYGVREFGMSAMMNGLAIYGGLIPFGGTFLTFLDYARNAVRMSALMKQRVIYIYTHDSIGLGEDGPTHQPIEHLTLLRVTPQVSLWRPCDSVETAVAWQQAIERRDGPTCLALSRQALPTQARDAAQIALIHQGGYILCDTPNEPAAIVMATGSEVSLAVAAAKVLAEQQIFIRVVSMPSVDVFAAQSPAYKEHVLPAKITARVAIEAGATAGWYQYVGLSGLVIGLDHYGESAPAPALYTAFGITSERVIESIKLLLNKSLS